MADEVWVGGDDPKTQAREFRRSAWLYRDIIRSGGITSEIVEAYAPALFQTLYQ